MGLAFGLLAASRAAGVDARAGAGHSVTNGQTFRAEGVVKELNAKAGTVVIAHEAIPNYMRAMTMPFQVKDPGELAALQPGDQIRFRLRVTDTTSWIEGLSKLGRAPVEAGRAVHQPSLEDSAAKPRRPLLDYPFTNELGQLVRLGDFRGQALAITFFFTQCPIPDYCPRLSKNFEEASAKLSALRGGPTNWHFLSVTFDPDFDTPAVLRAYGERYHYDPRHWSFVTGPRQQIGELASGSGVQVERASGFVGHNFRTLIIDAAGRVQMVFLIGGNLSEAIVAEVLKAAAVPAPHTGSNDAGAQPQTAAVAR